MSFNTECPKCQSENAYFDGVRFCCPDCDYEWDDDVTVPSDEDNE